MANRRDAEPSPLRAGVLHTGLSLLVFGGIAGALGAGIFLTGDPSEAGLAVLERQQRDFEAFEEDERLHLLHLDTTAENANLTLVGLIQERLRLL